MSNPVRKDELLNYLENGVNRFGVDYNDTVEKFATKWDLAIGDVKDYVQELINSGKVKREGSKIYHWWYLMPSEGSLGKSIPHFDIRV